MRVISIGRNPNNDVVLDYPMISNYHARITISDGAVTIEDLGSTNGTAIGSRERKITKSRLSPQDTVYFGSFQINAARLLLGKIYLGENSQSIVPFSGRLLIFGRDPISDQVLDYPTVSWHHARLSRSGDDIIVEDLNSTNGTFVNGRRISGPVKINIGDMIGLGCYTFQLTSADTFIKRDYRNNVTVEAKGVTVEVSGKRLLENVSLTLYPSEMVALMGPSGAGKTTLMRALNGYSAPTGGTVLLNGQDLYADYEYFRGRLGYVPQDDIMHSDLTVGQALYYTARLRLPSDYKESDIEARVQQVLRQLGLEGTENVLIGSPEKKGISGGQRKRVNLAMELLTDPSVLFLDEPTSGLSSTDTLMVMKLLRELADSGKTILLTIHQPGLDAYKMISNLVVLSKDSNSPEPAALAYYGPAYPDAIDFFNPNGIEGAEPGVVPSPDEVLRGLSRGKTKDWVSRYATSRYKREYVDERSGKQPAGTVGLRATKIARKPGVSQWWTLVRRCLAVKARDTLNTMILLAQAPIIAILISMVFGEKAGTELTSTNGISVFAATSTALFLLVLSALWLGCSNAAREIVGERAIYHRERMINLKIPSYVASKLTVLGGFCFIQCIILLGIVYTGCGLKSPWILMFGILLLTSFVGLSLGLLLSAVAKTTEAAIALVPLILIPMVILGGLMQPIHKMSTTAKFLSYGMASRWAFEGLMLVESNHRLKWAPLIPDPALNGTAAKIKKESSSEPKDMAEATDYFPKKERNRIRSTIAALCMMLTIFVAGILIVLRIQDIH